LAVLPIRRLIEKFAYFLLTLFLVVSLNFFLFRILPGDPVKMLFRDPRMTPQDLANLRVMFGLDQPLYIQYYLYLVNLLHGNLGVSFAYDQPVFPIVMQRLSNTVLLVGVAYIFFVLVGIFLGVLAAWKHGTRCDSFCVSFALTTYSVPTFWLSMLFIIVFSVWLGIFPTSGMETIGVGVESFGAYVLDLLSHLAMPVITLVLYYMGFYTILARSSLLEEFTQDYVLTARAKGMSKWQVIRKHTLRNAMLPSLTLAAINIGAVVGGVLQTEMVFSWPGIGSLTYEALLLRDYPLLQGAFLITALSVLAANFAVDILYTWLDPRVRY